MQEIIVKQDVLSIYFEETKSHIQIPSRELEKAVVKFVESMKSGVSVLVNNKEYADKI